LENIQHNSSLTKRKVLGLLGLIVFSLAFIFACLFSVLPIGRAIVGTFGIATYPLLIILDFYSLAKFLGLNYTKRMKPAVLLTIGIVSVLLVIHAISTFKPLDAVVSGQTFKTYLEISYTSNITLLGSVGSILCGLISLLLGGMGVIIVFVILTTLLFGLFIDYQLYGKYEAPHIKKLKTHKMREKVSRSDRDLVNENMPNYSFDSGELADVVDEISVDARDLEGASINENEPKPIYSSEDVIGEITDRNITEGYNYTYNNYSNVYTGSDSYFKQPDTQTNEEPQTQNTFSSNFYSAETYPDVYTSDVNEYRRQFMNATFGGMSSTESSENTETNYSNEFVSSQNPYNETPYSSQVNTFDTEPVNVDNEVNNFSSNLSDFSSNFGNDEETSDFSDETEFNGTFDNSSINDEISKILSTSEDDIENDVKSDVLDSPSSSSFGFSFDDDEKQEPVKANNDFGSFNKEPSVPKTDFVTPSTPSFEPAKPDNLGIDKEFERKNSGFGTSQNFGNTKPQVEQKPAFGGVSNVPSSPVIQNNPINNENKYTVPVKETKTNPYGFNVGIPGVRYNPPPLNLLRPPKPDNGDYTEEQNRKSAQLENVLSAFNIPAKVKNIVRGPKITRYELSVPLGVSVKKIPMYEDDIAAALAAKTIVIKAPIPGSSYVGIELENDTFSSVYERELLESDEFQNFKDPLPIAIGKDISGEIIVKSLAKMVHLLIAGSTGSGKSVFIHNIVLSLIYKSSPDDLRLIMIDPKKVEFNRYNGLPHLLTPEVVMGSDKAINALKWCVKEMERRYDLMSKSGYNNIEPYNKSELVKAGQFERFPYIVIIVDELAEIMQVNKKEVEACIQRLTQLARACGMHMILATQRPSVDIISGVIKNNVPSRIAFSLQSGIDSKTILNAVGAEKLLGQGDMIFAPTGTSATPRLQAAYASDEEIKAVIDYDKKYNNANYDEMVNNIINSEQQAAPDDAGVSFGSDGLPSRENVDSYFKTSVKLVMQNGGASVSYLQRRLSIGYSRAARIVDQMEDKGYIAPATGSKVRKVLITPDQFRQDFGEDYDSIND